MSGFRFELVKIDGAARLGRILTAHGAVETPAFMPVATQGSVKSLAPSDLLAAGAQIVLANTYHLPLRRAGGSPGVWSGPARGGSQEPLGRRAVEAIGGLALPGHSIGGLAVGEPKPLMYDITELVAGLLPADRPRYLMGVGKPTDLVEAVARGGDLLDSALPPQCGRHGQALKLRVPVHIRHDRGAHGREPRHPAG